MTVWNCTATAVLDEPVDHLTATVIGREAAGEQLVTVVVADTRLGVTAAPPADRDPLDALADLRTRLAVAVAARGRGIVGWAALEVLALDEVDRRVAAASLPEMVNTETFAELCGVTRQRISVLETERRAAAAEGRRHEFPTPVVPGWWLRSSAERYAATRKRKPGPDPKSRG